MSLGHIEHFEARARKELARRARHPLAMLERAGIVIGDAVGRGIAGLQPELDQKLGYVAGKRADALRFFAAAEMPVVLDRGAAA